MDCEVLVVGAGPTGLTAAVDLARRGVHVRVVESSAAYAIGTRARGLNARSLEVAEDLGVLDRLQRVGALGQRIRMYVKGRRTVDAVLTESTPIRRPGVPYPQGLRVGTADIEAALRDRLAELGGAVELDSALVGLAQDDDGVIATVRSGDGGERDIRAAYVIGADGGRSTVRRLLGLRFEGTTVDDRHLYVADVVLDGIEADESVHMWDTGVALAPNVHGGTWWMTADIVPDENGNSPEPSRELLERLFHERTGRRDVRLTDAPWLSKYRFNVRLVDRYRVGRVFVAGDAAHVHTPAGGQGMNTGVQDAYNLCWKLAAALRGADTALLDTYESERRPLAQAVLAQSTHRFSALGGRGPLGLLMGLVFRIRPLASRFWRWWGSRSSHLDLHYRESPLSRHVGTARLRLRAGDRMPDVRIGGAGEHAGERLFDRLRGTDWTVLRLPADAGDEARKLVGADADKVVYLVRPDGYIGLIAPDTPGVVADYLREFAGEPAMMVR